jgi:AcrR family transcriptional regulator
MIIVTTICDYRENGGNLAMAIKIKDILADTFLDLCENHKLENISIKMLLEESRVSRQSFYNHFIDKNDLIQYIYCTKIVPEFDEISVDIDFYSNLLDAFRRMKQYQSFLKQALLMQGQNNLRDYLFEHCEKFDLAWHQKRYGEKEMPLELYLATQYHAHASTSMTVSWIISDMPTSCEEMAELITRLRSVGMEKLFENAEVSGNPYKLPD